VLDVEYSSPVGACPASILSREGGHGKRNGLPVSDVEADVALSRCAPSGPRSLTPVVRLTGLHLTAIVEVDGPAEFDVAESESDASAADMGADGTLLVGLGGSS
jgi:hypothetical protein